MDTVDLLLVVATDVERLAVFEAARATTGRPQPIAPIHGKARTYHDLGAIAGARVALVQCEAGTATVGGALSTVGAAMDELQPAAVIMVGIAFGVDEEKQPLGMILVSRQLQQYDVQRVGTSDSGEVSLISRGDKPSASPLLLSRLRAASLPSDDIEFGLVLSGEKLVDNKDYRDAILLTAPEAVGGEMEGGGLYVAATERRRDWCIVKAICDYADGGKRENKLDRQALAARNAATFVLRALGSGGFSSSKADKARATARRTTESRLAHADVLDILDDAPNLARAAQRLLESSKYPCSMIVDGRPLTNPVWMPAAIAPDLAKRPISDRIRGQMLLITVERPADHPALYCYRSESWNAFLLPFYKAHPQDLVRSAAEEAGLERHVAERYGSRPIPTGHYMVSIKQNEEHPEELWLYVFEFYSVVVPTDFELTQNHTWLNLERLADKQYREAKVNGDVVRALKSSFGVGLHDLPRSTLP